MDAQIVDAVAVAVLTEVHNANAAVNAGLRPADNRWAALADDNPDKELFRTAVRTASSSSARWRTAWPRSFRGHRRTAAR
jgi:hypothetical protein